MHVKNERRRSLLKTEVTYRAEIIINCRIYEYKIYRRPVLNIVNVRKAISQI